MNDVSLEEVDRTCFLGIQTDRGLTWEAHVDMICSRIYGGFFPCVLLPSRAPPKYDQKYTISPFIRI